MDLTKSKAGPRSAYLYLFIIGIVLIAFNLRPGITSIGPLIGMIKRDVGLTHWSAGLLMSLPLVVFAIISPLVPKIAARLTNERALLIGLVVLIIGISMRSIPMAFFLFCGTLFVGAGITLGNVLLPAVVKEKFPQKFGLMTSVYSVSLGLMASLASGVSVPFATKLNLGWQGAQFVWVIPAILAIIVWTFLLKSNQKSQQVQMQAGFKSPQMWRSPLAWQVALFFGCQSFLFYVTISWLPEILHSQGMSLETAGWMLAFTQIVGLPASFIVPVLAGRYQSQVWIAFTLGMCSILGYSGLLFGSSYPILIISIVLIGIVLGGSFTLVLSYIGLRARNGTQAAALSGMAQSTGYILAAIGPLFIGYLYDLTHVWTTPLIALIVVSFLVMIFSMIAGRNRYV
ncbi:MFS transporter [Bacillus sp. B15-48]|uniref:CynX/NimT family MFS transporter n=1 Tax=Bacillus sp. B15-48 TaxID=1548601 RepID=UPI001EF3AE09|nr:MFS transporter [Bacillus sp. B15-48]